MMISKNRTLPGNPLQNLGLRSLYSQKLMLLHGSVFGELFGKFEMEKVRAWTSALVEAANLSGIGLIHYRYQENRVKEIVEIVLSKLNFDNVSFKQNAMEIKHDESRDTTSSREKLVGIEHRMQQVKALLEADTGELAQNNIYCDSQTLKLIIMKVIVIVII